MVMFIPWEMRIKKIESKCGRAEEWGGGAVPAAREGAGRPGPHTAPPQPRSRGVERGWTWDRAGRGGWKTSVPLLLLGR